MIERSLLVRFLAVLAFIAFVAASSACDDETATGEDTGDDGVIDLTSTPDSGDDADAVDDSAGTPDGLDCLMIPDICDGDTRAIICKPEGREIVNCTADEICEGGGCRAVICEPGRVDSCTAEGLYQGCSEKGTAEGEFACPAGLTCADGICQARICDVGESICGADDDSILVCNTAGTAFVEGSKCTDTDAKRVCDDGVCKPICEAITKTASYIGCDYWAVDLDNYWDTDPRFRANEQPFAVVVSNATGNLPALVTVWDHAGEQSGIPLVPEFTLMPGELRTLQLPPNCYNSSPSCSAATAIDDTVRRFAAYHIVADVPITAYQFNPLENVGVFSNDASLLLPQPSLGTRYRVMTRNHEFLTSPGFMTVVATEPGFTNVTITPSEPTDAGCASEVQPCPVEDLIDQIPAGQPRTFTLEQYEVLNLASLHQSDLTGSEIVADERIAVFAGVECVDIPETMPRTQACDHIEQQMIPINAWGRTYHGVKTSNRGYPGVELEPCADNDSTGLDPDLDPIPSGERDFWRILARQDGTVVTTNPDQTGGPITLNAGEWHEFASSEDFEIDATRQILVGQFLSGIQDPLDPSLGQPGDLGDPAFTLSVPVQQYRREYVFLAPDKYFWDFVTIVAETGTSVLLDGVEVPADEFAPFGTGEYSAAKLKIADGVHTISSEEPTGVYVYGVDCAVSYAYPAGLDLQDIFE